MATVMPAPASRPASEGPACPAPMTMASKVLCTRESVIAVARSVAAIGSFRFFPGVELAGALRGALQDLF